MPFALGLKGERIPQPSIDLRLICPQCVRWTEDSTATAKTNGRGLRNRWRTITVVLHPLST